MKLMKALVLLMVCSFAFTTVQAQTKKELKAEVDRLTSSNTVLQNAVVQLQSQNRKLSEDVTQAQTDLNRVKRDSARLATDYNLLTNEYIAYKQQAATTAAENTATTSTSYVDPSDNRACALKQPTLQSGYSYTMSLGRLNSNGWGVQVYSSDNLCNAMEKAESFSNYYTMYKTYIRVKVVGSKRVFSVVYGSLKDYEQAKTYCRLFRENARSKEASGAFLVQH